ncbi:MAG TPA: glycosyltransferase family 2 protein, partial [Xanthomonadaceae bacterium]|nr:glycosyltransferase family 2 protein [Xanthomonadaceae bacterium]
MAAPLVSVVMPVRDGGAWLGEAVDSILGQSLEDIELIVVDDHSRDGAVASLPARRDPRLRVLSSPAPGVVAASNAGMAAARGAFIARMDADDIAAPGRLARQVAYLEDHPGVDLCGTQVEIFGAAAGEGAHRYGDWLNALTSPEAIAAAMYIESPLAHPSLMLRGRALDTLGRAPYRAFDGPEDYELLLRADAAGLRMGKPQGMLLRWRDHDGRLTRSDARYRREAFFRCKAGYLVSSRVRGRDLVILGASVTGALLFDVLQPHDVSVRGFVDPAARRHGGRKRGHPVHGPEWLASLNDDVLLLVAAGRRGARAEIQS